MFPISCHMTKKKPKNRTIKNQSFEIMGKTFDNINELAIAQTDEPVEKEGQQREAAPKRESRTNDRKKVAPKKEGKTVEEKLSVRVIKSKSPVVYLLPEEKAYLDKLKAFILLETGEKTSDHSIVMAALKDYARKNYKEFSSRY